MSSKLLNSNYLKFLVFFFCLLLVVGSLDNNEYNESYTVILQNIFFGGISHSYYKFFSFLDIIIISISFFLIKNVGIDYKNSLLNDKLVVFLQVIPFVMLLLNPNNNTTNPIFGLPLLSNVSYYTKLIFIISIFFLRDFEWFFYYVVTVVKYFIVFLLIRAGVQLVLFGMGLGSYKFFGFQSVLIEDDTLMLYAIVQNITLALFFITKRKKFVIITAFIVFFLFLSFRRTNIFFTLGSDAMVILIYAILKKGHGVFKFFLFASIIFVILVSLDINSVTQSRYFERYFGMFFIPQQDQKQWQGDSGHFALNEVVYEQAVGNIHFWGLGLQKEEEALNRILDTFGVGIHNAYLGAYFENGIVAFFCLVGIVLIFVIQFLQHIRQLMKMNKDYALIKFSILSTLLMFFVSSFYFGYYYYNQLKLAIIFNLLLASLLRIKPHNYTILLKYMKYSKL